MGYGELDSMGKYEKSSFWRYSLWYGVIAFVFGLVMSIYVIRTKEQAQQLELNHLAAQRLAVLEEVARRQDRLIRELNLENLPEGLRIQLLDQFQATAVTAAATSDTAVTKVAIDSLLDKQFGDLSDRIKQIEDRFPSDATIDKIASVNDAILGTRLESIEKLVTATRSEMKTLRGDMLNKWDVVVVVIMLLGAIATLTRVAIGAIEYIKRKKASSNAS